MFDTVNKSLRLTTDVITSPQDPHIKNKMDPVSSFLGAATENIVCIPRYVTPMTEETIPIIESLPAVSTHSVHPYPEQTVLDLALLLGILNVVLLK